MKKLSSFVTAIAMMFGLLGVVLVATPVQAAVASTPAPEPPSCDDVKVGEGTGNCADVVSNKSHSKSGTSSEVVAINGVDIKSKVTVLARIKAKGTPKRKQTNCFRTKRAMSAWTTYNAEGTTGSHWKSYPKGYRFCKINGKIRDPKCHNIVKIGVPKSKPPKNAIKGKVKFVKRLKFGTEAVAKADEKVTSRAEAWCTTNSGSAYGMGKASASAYAVGRASLTGRVLTKVLARVRAMANSDLAAKLSGKSVTKVKAEVRASALTKATSEASAQASCTDTPPPVTGSVSCKLPPHMYFPNGNGLVFCQTSKSDGSTPKLSEFKIVGDEYTHLSQVETTPYSDDANTPCPSGETCFRAQIWADKVGFSKVTATFLNDTWEGTLEVKEDEF